MRPRGHLAPDISLYLPTSPYLSLSLPISPDISLPLPVSPCISQACDLAVTAPVPIKGGAHLAVKAGGELSFNLGPRDRFGNDA